MIDTNKKRGRPPVQYQLGSVYGQYVIVAKYPASRDTSTAVVKCSLCGKRIEKAFTKLDRPHRGCKPVVKEKVNETDLSNGGLGTRVLRVRKNGTPVRSKDDGENYVDVLVDDDYDGEYFNDLLKYMSITKAGYVQVSNIRRDTRVYLHHLVLQPPKGMWVHFKNGNPLDCRTTNLEQMSPKEALSYRKPRDFTLEHKSTSWSQYKGVAATANNTWIARFRGEIVGTYTSEIEAAKAYDKANFAYHGNLRQRLNFPEEIERTPSNKRGPYKRSKAVTEPVVVETPTTVQVGYCLRCGLLKTVTDSLCEGCKEEINERKR